MKAITTKYIPATNYHCSRVKAFDGDGNSVTIPYDSDLNRDEPFVKAAIILCRKMKWTGKLVSGGTKDGWVFCFAQSETYDIN
jgi:hypothetical protein